MSRVHTGVLVWLLDWLESRIRLPASDSESAIASITDVTEQIEREQAQHEITRRYRALVEQTTSATALVDRTGHLLVATPSLDRLLDGALSEAPDADLIVLVFARLHPSDRNAFDVAWRHSVETGEAGHVEVRIGTSSSSYRWYDSSGEPQDDAADELSFSVTLTEVAEHRLPESSALQLSESLASSDLPFFRALVEHMAEALQSDIAVVGEIDPDDPDWIQTRAVWLDGAPSENFRYPLAGSPCEKVVAGQLSLYPAGVQHIFPGFNLFAQRHIDSYAGMALRNSAGVAIGIAASMRRGPVTDTDRSRSLLRIFGDRAGAELDREQLRRALHRSEDMYRSLAETAGSISLEVEPGRAVVYVSPGVEAILGRGPEEFLAWNARDWVHPDDLEAVEESVLEIISSQTPGDLSLRIQHADGHWCSLSGEAHTVRSPGGGVRCVLTLHDVTTLVRAESNLAQFAAG